MEIRENDYSVVYAPENRTVVFSGTVRLQGITEYEPIKNLLNQAGEGLRDPADRLTLDFNELRFLNSSGITTISMFVIAMRKKAIGTIVVRGTKAIAW